MKPTHNLLCSTPPALQLHLPEFKRINLTLVGCGGTGSHFASSLVALAEALDARGISSQIVLIDRDIVEEKNVGRQLFALADIGKPKAMVLAERLNAAFGTRFGSLPRAIATTDTFVESDSSPREIAGPAINLVIGAVDNPAARALIAKAVENAKGRLWWLDGGNENHSGQVVLGNVADPKEMRGAAALGMIDRLPAPHLVYPDLLHKPRAERKSKQSCAELTASGEQGLMVNRMVAAWMSSMLSDLLITHELRYFAVRFDLHWAGTQTHVLDVPTLAAAVGMRTDQLVAKRRNQNDRK